MVGHGEGEGYGVGKAATERCHRRWSWKGFTDNSFWMRDKQHQYAFRRWGLFFRITRTSQTKKNDCGAWTGTFHLFFAYVSLRTECHRKGLGSGKSLLPCTYEFHTCQTTANYQPRPCLGLRGSNTKVIRKYARDYEEAYRAGHKAGKGVEAAVKAYKSHRRIFLWELDQWWFFAWCIYAPTDNIPRLCKKFQLVMWMHLNT